MNELKRNGASEIKWFRSYSSSSYDGKSVRLWRLSHLKKKLRITYLYVPRRSKSVQIYIQSWTPSPIWEICIGWILTFYHPHSLFWKTVAQNLLEQTVLSLTHRPSETVELPTKPTVSICLLFSWKRLVNFAGNLIHFKHFFHFGILWISFLSVWLHIISDNIIKHCLTWTK